MPINVELDIETAVIIEDVPLGMTWILMVQIALKEGLQMSLDDCHEAIIKALQIHIIKTITPNSKDELTPWCNGLLKFCKHKPFRCRKWNKSKIYLTIEVPWDVVVPVLADIKSSTIDFRRHVIPLPWQQGD